MNHPINVSGWENVRPDDDAETPGLDEFEVADGFLVVPLESLVRMKLTAFR